MVTVYSHRKMLVITAFKKVQVDTTERKGYKCTIQGVVQKEFCAKEKRAFTLERNACKRRVEERNNAKSSMCLKRKNESCCEGNNRNCNRETLIEWSIKLQD